MKILNLYAGLGGNRKLWDGVEVVSVEHDPQIADVYRRLYPHDLMVEDDAHKYLFEHSGRFGFIWSSPPCQSHGRMVKASRHKPKAYPDMSLYQEIIFLQNFARCPWVIENVIPYYKPLISPTAQIGRHLYWSNFDIPGFEEPKAPVYVDGQLFTTLKGDRIVEEFQVILDEYVHKRYGKQLVEV